MVGGITPTTNVGAYAYQAPERHKSSPTEKGYGIESDVWSFGLTIYKIVTGRLPFDVDLDEIAYSNQVYTCPDIQLPNDSAHSSQSVCDLVAHCLRNDKHQRLSYEGLLELDFMKEIDLANEKPGFAAFVCETLNSKS